MLQEAIEKLLGLGAFEKFEVGGETYLHGAGKVLPLPRPIAKPLAKPLRVQTISSFCRAILANIDRVDIERTLIIATHDQLKWVTNLNSDKAREDLIVAEHLFDWKRMFDSDIDLRLAVPMLGVGLQNRGDYQRVIDLLSSVSLTNTTKQSRSGLGWRVTADEYAEGADNGWHEVDEPFFNLAPFRTFPEIEEQELSRTLIDVNVKTVKQGDDKRKIVTVCLSAADGESWQPKVSAKVAQKVGETFRVIGQEMGYQGPVPAICA